MSTVLMDGPGQLVVGHQTSHMTESPAPHWSLERRTSQVVMTVRLSLVGDTHSVRFQFDEDLLDRNICGQDVCTCYKTGQEAGEVGQAGGGDR